MDSELVAGDPANCEALVGVMLDQLTEKVKDHSAYEECQVLIESIRARVGGMCEGVAYR